MTTLTTVTILTYNEGEVILMEIRKGKLRMEAITVPRYNIRDTKRYYSDLNNLVLKGIEVITFNAISGQDQVSHIKTSYLDRLLNELRFQPITEKDEELQVYTIALQEIDLYGEGVSVEDATEELVTSIVEFLNIYIQKLDMFAQVESELKQLYLLKLLRCNGDREKIKKAIGR